MVILCLAVLVELLTCDGWTDRHKMTSNITLAYHHTDNENAKVVEYSILCIWLWQCLLKWVRKVWHCKVVVVFVCLL